jgi:hypothetical protein
MDRVMKGRLLLICVILVASAIWYFSGHVSQEEMNAMIERNIPLGSSTAEVKAVLSSYGMKYTGLIETDVISDFDSYPGRKRVVSASLKGFRVGSIISEGIFVNFLFDRDDRLIDYRVREVFTF